MISVVMAAYNAEKFIAASIESVFSQTYDDWELIIVDDCSTDSTVEIVKSYNSDKIVLLRNNENRGPAFSRNRALDIARGEFVAILDSDDIAMSYRFEKQLLQFKNNPYLVMSAGGASVIDEDGEEMNIVYSSSLDLRRFKLTLLFNCAVTHSSVMYKTCYVREKCLKYDLNYPCNQDYKLWTDFVMFDDFDICVVPDVYVKYRISKSQITSRKHEVQLKFGERLRKSYAERMGLLHTTDFLRVLSCLECNEYHGSGFVSYCESTFLKFRKSLLPFFSKKDIDKLMLDNLRWLYIKKYGSYIKAGIRYLYIISRFKMLSCIKL